jgi:hypothetical protein
MHKFKKSAWVVVSILALLVLFGLWYKHTYSMDIAEAMEINDASLDRKLLIATQGSDFKNSLTQSILDHYKKDSVFIKIIDVSDLDKMDPNDFNAVLVMHTWEYEKPPTAVGSFIEKTKSFKNKIVVMTTSGPGTSTMEGVDAITGESIKEDVPVYAVRIIERLDPLIVTEN